MELYVFFPDKKIFSYQPTGDIQENGTIHPYILEKVNYIEGKGVFLKHQGQLYPRKGVPFPQAILCTNVSKRLFRDFIYLFAHKLTFGLYFGLLFVPFKKKIQFLDTVLETFNNASELVTKPVALKDEYLSPMPKELKKLIKTFLEALRSQQAERAASLISLFFQYDNAYNYRLLDIFSETNKANLLNSPVSEMKRVIKIYSEREPAIQIQPKVNALFLVLRIILLLKPFKKAFQKAVLEVNWSNLRYDIEDIYHILERGDYNYTGRTYEQRIELYNDWNKKIIPQFTICP